MRGVDRALIYVSWACRDQGEAGLLPQAVDLFVIGSGNVNEIRAAADIAGRKLGRNRNVTVLTPSDATSRSTTAVANEYKFPTALSLRTGPHESAARPPKV